MLQRLALVLIFLETAFLAVVVMEAGSLAGEVKALRDRVDAAPIARQEERREQLCDRAVWPAIPAACLQRVAAAR